MRSVTPARVIGGVSFTGTREVTEAGTAVTREERIGEALKALKGSSVVYYIQDGGLIKIGKSTDVVNRFRKLRLPMTALLAIEPGGLAVESERHQRFAEDRAYVEERPGAREWYHPTADVLGHINDLRRSAGLPPVEW
jgi:hypothetical protein